MSPGGCCSKTGLSFSLSESDSQRRSRINAAPTASLQTTQGMVLRV
jgi:hypothetical protein